MCADWMLIDDLEDGDGSICATDGRAGGWYAFGDGTTSAELTPRPDVPFAPTLIEEGARGTSRYAARMWGSGFTAWGALMGVSLATGQGYDATGLMGVRFWMRSTTPISVAVVIPETETFRDGGECVDSAIEQNCNNHFAFSITAPTSDWVEYQVPFNALRQMGGSAIWNPRRVTNISFSAPAGAEFDVSVDDLSFYACAGPECPPTCTDPQLPVSCRQMDSPRSSCHPMGTDCALVGRVLDPVVAASGGGDPGCVGYPPEQPARCYLDASTGIPFATAVYALTDGISNARLRNPEPGKVCIQGTLIGGGTAAISFKVTPFTSESDPLTIDPFDLQALDIHAIEFTITDPPRGGVSFELNSVVKPECSLDFDCVGPTFLLGGPNASVFEDATVRAEVSDFEPADPGPTLVWAFHVVGHSTSSSDTNYDFCLEDVKFLDSRGESVTPPAADGG
jgi:hypothetical protein